MAKKKQKTVEEIREQMRQNSFSTFTVGDGKERHTVEEVRQAAIQQGLIKPSVNIDNQTNPLANSPYLSFEEKLYYKHNPLSAPQPVNFASAAAAAAARKGGGAFDLANQVARTNSETMPRIANTVANQYRGAQAAQDRIAGYNDKTRYTDVQSDINNTKNVRAGAARRGRDTTAYDTAIGMLENYSKQRYRLDDTDTSPEAVEDKRKKYESNLQEIDKLEKQIYDMTGGKRQGFGEDRTEVNKLQARVDALKAENTVYERTQQKVDEYDTKYAERAERYLKDVQEANTQNLLYGGLHTRNQVPKDYNDTIESTDTTAFVDAQPFIRRYADNPSDPTVAYRQIDAHTEQLTEQEKKIYSFLVNNYGRGVANNYLDDLKDTLQKRATDERTEYIENAPAGEKALLLAASVPFNVYGAATGFVEDAYNILTGEDIHPYSEAHSIYNIGQATRSAVANDIDEATGGANLLGFSMGDAFQAAMSIPDFTLGALTPEFYIASMSMGAAQSRAKELWEEGASYDQIVLEGVLSGAAEALFEEISLDKIVKMAKGGTLKDYIKTALKGMAIEGSEEINTEIANIITDIAARGSQSDWAKKIEYYKDQGYNDKDANTNAFLDMLKQIGYAGVGGAIGGFGGSMGVAAEKAANLIDESRYQRAAGQSISNAGNIKSLIDLAYQSADAKIRQSGQELEKLNRKQSTGNAVRDRIRQSRTQKRAGQLYTELQKNNIEQFKNAEQSVRLEAIENLYAEQIDDKERKDPTVSKVAKLIDKAVTGQTLTQREQRTVSSPSAQAVINKIKEDTDLLESQTKQAKAKALGDYAKTQKLVMPKETETINDDDVNTDEFIISKKDDGKVYKDNEVVETGAITDISGDDIKVETGNSNTDSVKTLSMPTEQAVLYQSLMDVQNETGIELSPAIANDIVSLAQSNDNDLSLSQSVRAATQALVKGYTNNSNEYNSDSYAAKLSDSTRQKFYDLGRELASAQTAEQQQRVLDRVSAQDNMREGTVTYEDDIDYNKLDSRRKASVDFVEAYAKVNGTDVVFFASKPDGKGRRSSKYVTENRLAKDGEQAPNGFWHDGKMYIDINAGMNGEGLVLFTMSHEIVHMIREGSPEDYKALADFLISKYAEKGIDVDDLVRLKREEYGAPKYLAIKEMGKSTNLTYDEALEEVIADSCESFLLDLADAKRGAEISQQLKKENPTLWERIKDALYNILQRVRNAYRLAKPQSREAQIIAQMKDIIEPAYEIYVRGYTNAARNLRNMEGGVSGKSKYSFAGRNAATADIGTLSEAEQLEAEGVGSEDIRQQTGWFKSMDGKWRFEIDDSDMAINITDKNSYFLGDFLKHQKLFEAYPALDDVVVEFLDLPKGERGHWDSYYNRIAIRKNLKSDPEAVSEILVHEIQHAVQSIEGFASGASTSHWQSVINKDKPRRTKNEREALDRAFDELTAARDEEPREFTREVEQLYDSAPNIPRGEVDWNTLEQIEPDPPEWVEFDKKVDELEKKYGENRLWKYWGIYERADRAIKNKGSDNATELYYRTAGEIEARDSSARRALNSEQRKNTRPDIDSKDVVFAKYQSRTDSEYLSAVERGDMETAQRMVDEAAKRTFADSKIRSIEGKLKKVYHGTGKDFSVFDNGRFGTNYDGWGELGRGFYATDNKKTAKHYAERSKGDLSKIMEGYIDIKKPLYVYEALPDEIDLSSLAEKHNIPYWGVDGMKRNAGRMIDVLIENGEDVQTFLKQFGYDGIIEMSGKGDMHQIVFFDSNQFKSADPVTYDDNGNVIPLSERFNPENKDIRYQQRSQGYDFNDFEVEFGEEIEDTLAREFETHHEDIGEVLRNTADIEITAAKVGSIVNRVIKNNLGEIDSKSRDLLSLEIQIALEQVNRKDAEAVTNDIISAVRDAIENAMIVDERSKDNYNELRQYFGNDKYYLTDKMLAYLARRGMSLGDYRKRMYQKINIVKQGTPNARKLSLESMHEVLDAPDEYLGFSADEWDSHEEDTPVILMNAFDTLKERRMVAFTEYNNDEQELDERAVELAAKITGAIVQEKYNSRQNPYVSKLVEKLRAQRSEAVKKQKEKNRKKLAELKQKERERADKREQELKEKYQEQRANAHESRQRTEFRNRIRRIADNFNKRLNAPKAKQYIPQEFIKQTLDVLNLVAFKGKRGVTISSTLSDLRETYNELQDDYKGAYASPVEKMLSVISKQSKQEAKEWVPKRNKAIEQENKRLQKQGKPLKKYVTEADFTVNNMSLDLLDLVYKCFSSLDYTIREAVEMTDTKFKQDAHQLGRSWIAEIIAVPKEHSGAVSGWIQTMLSPERFFDRIAGFKKNSTSLQLYDMLNDGQLRMTQLEMEFTQIFDALIKDSKQLKSLYDTKHLVDIGLEDENGNKVEITRGMMISLYMHLLNEDNTRHVMGGGLTVPDMIDYYKGDIKKAYGKGMQRVRVGALDYSRYAEGIKSVIENELTDYEIAWIEAAHDFFDVASRKALNETTMKLYGFKRANVDNYFPIHTDSNYRAANFEAIQRDMSLENSGFMKERVKASNPILLEDIVDVVNHQIAQVSKYCGMTLPIKNFQKVYGTTTRDFESSVQEVLNKKFSGTKNNTGATKYIDNFITDLTTGRSTDEGPIAKRLGRMRGFLAQSTLTLNPRVAIAQAASYSTAAAEIGWKPLLKALKNGGKNNRVFSRADQELIAEISPYLWKRTQGYSNVEIGDINELRKQKHKVQGKVKKAMSWIEFFDGMTVGRLFYACQYYVDEQFPELKRGTEEYNKKLADVYNKVIERTQPNYTVAQRPDILRNPNALVKSLTMFMTQRLQNFNIVYSAAGKYNKYLKDYKAGINDVTAEDVKAAKVGLRRAIVSQTVSAATIVGMKLLADALLHSMTGYRDDDDELTAQSVSLKLLNNFADTIFGSVLFGSELYSLISSLVTGERYYGISLSGVDSLSDALDSVTKLRKGVDLDSINGVAKSICQLLGIPLANAEKIATGVYNHAVDISEGEFMSFESGVDRTRKQDIHRIELAYNSGDKEKANKIKNELLKTQTDKGKTDKEALSWLRNGFTAAYKPLYIEAVKNNDAEKIKNIRELLYFTGAYGTLAEQDKAMQKWLKNEE